MTELDRKREASPCWLFAGGAKLLAALDRQDFRDWRLLDNRVSPTGDLACFRGHPAAWYFVSFDDVAMCDFLRSPKALLNWSIRVDKAQVLLITVGPEDASWRRVVGFGVSANFALDAPEIPRGQGGLAADVIAHAIGLRQSVVELNTPIGLAPQGGVQAEMPRGVVTGYRHGPIEPSISGRLTVRSAAREAARLTKPLAFCASNEFYGHGAVIRRYCGGVDGLPIRGRLQHGWHPDDAIQYDHVSLLAPTFTWNARISRAASYIVSDVHTVGAPYLYLPELPDPGPLGNGLLIGATHSLMAYKVVTPWAGYAQAIRRWAEIHGFDFATAIVHHHDNNEATEAGFASAGIPMVCAGTPGSDDFLYKLRYYIRAHTAVLSDRLSTILFYALAENRGAYVDGPHVRLSEPDFGDDLVTDRNWVATHYPGIFAGGLAGVKEAHSEIGLDSKRSPSDLRQTMFGWAVDEAA